MNQALEKIVFEENQCDPTTITKKLNKVLELKLFELQRSLMKKKQNFLNSFNLNEESKEELLNHEILQNSKKNFNFKYNEATEKIHIESKFNATEEEID